MNKTLILIAALILLTNCEKTKKKVIYPFLELYSFENAEDVERKVIDHLGMNANFNDDMGNLAGSINFSDTSGISSRCYLEFDSDESLIWFQSWYRLDNDTDKGDDFLVEWFSDFYETDTLTNINNEEVVVRIKGNETYHFTNLTTGSNEVLYFGQYFTDKIADPNS